MTTNPESSKNRWLKSRTDWVLLGFLAIAVFFLIAEHRAHILGILPWLLLFTCPVLDLLLHRGHGGHGGGDQHPHHTKPSAGDKP